MIHADPVLPRFRRYPSGESFDAAGQVIPAKGFSTGGIQRPVAGSHNDHPVSPGQNLAFDQQMHRRFDPQEEWQSQQTVSSVQLPTEVSCDQQLPPPQSP